jgi:pimeloyl-ACP methyl ester carboxylesterase
MCGNETLPGMGAELAVLDFEGRDGLHLVCDRRGDPRHAPVLFLHGGGQTRHSWGGTAARVAQRGWQALTLDARGHGDSAWSEVGDYRLETFAEDVRLVLARLDDPPVLVGASLGGLTSILLTGELAPGVARSVVLVDIVPDIEEAGAKRIGAFMVERAETGFSSIEEVAEAVAAYNPRRPRPSDLTGLRKNLRERGGRFYWHWDPRFLGGEDGSGPDEVFDVDRLNAAAGRMVTDVPVMLVRGRVSDLVSEDKAAQFCARFPTVAFVDVSDAGHMVAGDQNDAFTASVVEFLERHSAPIA